MLKLNRRSILLAGSLSSALGQASAAAPRAALQAVGLRTAMRSNPLGIDDPRPGLSWRLTGPAGTLQSAYQVIVASTLENVRANTADLWDSGRTPGAACTGVAYGGAALASRQRCFWRVRVWDGVGQVSDWSAPAAWEMGLLDDADWMGDWLAVESQVERDDREAGVRWVSGTTASRSQPCTFRLAFRSGGGEGLLTIIADGKLSKLALDGDPIVLPARGPNAYGDPPAIAFPLAVAPGGHVLTAEVVTKAGPSGSGTASIAAQLRIPSPDGGVTRVVDGWETRSGDQAPWGPASVPESQPHFPWPPTPARLLRRAFHLSGKPRGARLYVSALGGYRLWINGRRVGDDELQSEGSEYRRHVPYRTYDVTALLREGDNAMGALVGDGFYASYQAPDGRYAYGPAPRRLRLFIESRDAAGRIERVETDRDWRHAPSPILMSEIYAGEDQDLRLWPSRWAQPNFDDGDWSKVWTAPAPPAKPCAPLAEPIREVRVLKPVSIRRAGPGRHIIDFGQNFAGRVRLKIKGARGDRVIVRHAEILAADGELDRRNLRVARAEDRYVLGGGGVETLQPVFTYQGFRYAEVEGPAALTPDGVEGVVLSSNLPEIGVFRVGEPTIQKLWLDSLWSQRSNFMGVPTDCPQRDERLGWTGDAQVFWETAAFNMDVGGFTRSFTRILRDDQAANGAYPMWSPSPRGLGWNTTTATPGWADAGVMLPYVGYLHTGDRAVVDDNWSAMSAYLTGILAENPDGLWRAGRGADLGDWLALDAKQPGDETTPKDLIATAMLARSVDQLAQMAAWTGRSSDAERWRRQAQETRAAFARTFVRADGTVGNGSHTGYILALRLGLLPSDLRKPAGEKLAADIRRRGGLISTGFLGTPLALDALADVGETRLAFDLLLRTDYPSWGYMVRRGATTTWERWNSDTGDVSMNSFNHYALGAVCAFLYRRVAGIEPTAPGFSQFRVAPLIDRRIGSAGATLDCVRGRIETSWRVVGDRVSLTLQVPPNSRAEVSMPGLRRVVGAGHHQFEAPCP
ncbi:family 78 glycoside hydrolase catalytic domain [Caulobacter rhizosphaerae]|uniref:family 78 glycoside hydrolase catalytic domain n=1 Tax=Caulobacter rhizosphaerae TaxID=2010972 RepID=UPI0013D7C430|nr:family 78 glycoside hydrolase catalytic domain [Caulobacter rhizosphaerae]